VVQESGVIEFLAVEVEEAELQIAVGLGVFTVRVQELFVTAEWYFVIPDNNAIEVVNSWFECLEKRLVTWICAASESMHPPATAGGTDPAQVSYSVAGKEKKDLLLWTRSVPPIDRVSTTPR